MLDAARTEFAGLLSRVVRIASGLLDVGTALCLSDYPAIAADFVAYRLRLLEAAASDVRQLGLAAEYAPAVQEDLASAQAEAATLRGAFDLLTVYRQAPPPAARDAALSLGQSYERLLIRLRTVGAAVGVPVEVLERRTPESSAYYERIIANLPSLFATPADG